MILFVLLLSQQLGWVFLLGLGMLAVNTVAVDRLGIAIKNNQMAKMGLAGGRIRRIDPSHHILSRPIHSSAHRTP